MLIDVRLLLDELDAASRNDRCLGRVSCGDSRDRTGGHARGSSAVEGPRHGTIVHGPCGRPTGLRGIPTAMLGLALCALLVPLRDPTAGPDRPLPQGRPQRIVDDLWSAEDLEDVVTDIVGEIEAIRGKRFLFPVAVQLTDRESIRRRTRERYQAQLDSADLFAEEMSAKLLGLLPGDLDLQAASLQLLDEQVGWFYEPAEAVFHLAADYTTGYAQLVLVRGLTRIFDAQHHGLQKTAESLTLNTDGLLALEAVASGSASALEATWLSRHGQSLSERERINWPTALDPDGLEDTPAYLWKPMAAFALRGYTFLQRSSVMSVMLQGARVEDIEQALRDPPLSTEQVLHPVKYWKESREDLPRSIEFDLTDLPEGWQVLREDTLGELYTGMLVEPDPGLERSDVRPGSPLIRARYTCEASEGWGGDQYVLLRGERGYLLHMVTVWDAIADAGEYFTALQRLRPRLLESLGEVSVPQNEEECGVLVGFGPTHDEVHYTAWVGLTEDEVAGVLARLTHTIAG